MKRKVLTGINALIALLLGILGLNGCFRLEYGTPYATFEATGTITNEENKPLENIQVVVKRPGFYEYVEEYTEDRRKHTTEPFDPFTDCAPNSYTDADGAYQIGPHSYFPTNSVEILVRDTSGVYASDSVSVKVDYDRSKVKWGDNWDSGAGYVHQDFQLKKK